MKITLRNNPRKVCIVIACSILAIYLVSNLTPASAEIVPFKRNIPKKEKVIEFGPVVEHGSDSGSSYVKVDIDYNVVMRSIIERARITKLNLNWWTADLYKTLKWIKVYVTLHVGSSSRTWTYIEYSGTDPWGWDRRGVCTVYPNTWVSHTGSGGVSVKIETKIKYEVLIFTRYLSVSSTIPVP